MAHERKGIILEAILFVSCPLFQSQINLSQVPRRKGIVKNCMCEANERIITPGCKILRTQGNSGKLIKSLVL